MASNFAADEDDEESKSLTVQHMPASFNIAIIDQHTKSN